MRKNDLTMLALSFLLMATVACKQETAKNDADVVDHDPTDTLIDLDVIPDGTDKDVFDGDDAATEDDSSLLTDEGVPDEDTFCPSLETVELPFRDEKSNIHFCRPCDLPAKADDPKCVRNLWDAANKKLATDYPEQECYPYPCVIEGLKPGAGSLVDPDCDFLVTPDGTHPGINMYKHYALNNGQVAWEMGRIAIPGSPEDLRYPAATSLNIMDLGSKTYRTIMPSGSDIIGYSNGLTLAIVSDYNKIKSVETAKLAPKFLIAYDDTNGYRPVFDFPITGVSMNGFMNEKWFVAHFKPAYGEMATRYARIGEWKWKTFSGGLEYIATLSGDMFGYFTSSYIGYVCDLSKSPQTAGDCIKVNRGNELVDYVTMDKENSKRFAFTPFDFSKPFQGKLVLGEIQEDNSIIYDERIITVSEPNPYVIGADDFRGDLILYAELWTPEGSSKYDSKLCFYKISENKSYCPSGWNQYDMGKSEFEGKWLVFQGYVTESLVARDLECYCGKFPDSCPPGLVMKKVNR